MSRCLSIRNFDDFDFKMPDSCCAVSCQNRREGKNRSLSFYNIPSRKTPIEQRRRKEWIRALRRDDWKSWTEEQISKQKVCSEHFISGKLAYDLFIFVLQFKHVEEENDCGV